jgi:hypothetical protein
MKRGRDSDYDDDDVADERQAPEVEKKKETKKEKKSDALRIGMITGHGSSQVNPDAIVKIITRHLESFTARKNLEAKSFRFNFHSEWKSAAELAEAITAGPGGQFDFFIVDETDWMHAPYSERWLPRDMGTSKWIATSSFQREARIRALSVIRGTKKWSGRYCATGPIVDCDPISITDRLEDGSFRVDPPSATGWERFLILSLTKISIVNSDGSMNAIVANKLLEMGVIRRFYSGYEFSNVGEKVIRDASEKAFVKQLVDIHPEIPRQTGEAMKKAFATKPLSVVKTVPEKDPDNPAKRRLITKEMSQFPEALEDEMASFLGKFGKMMRVQGGFKCPI